jgi:hypothetical protein
VSGLDLLAAAKPCRPEDVRVDEGTVPVDAAMLDRSV